ncbi:hypothetical protein ABE073_04070 [Lederbergia citrisecunda]|uniref:ParM/StbA family protein n=1 Tax=Lederbergia citrisecunda TaxID=2833583 RepID=UPI003D2BF702
MILGIDAGNYKAKTVGEYGVDNFHTNICEWFKRNIKESFGADDMEFVIDGQRGFAGLLAKHEDEFGGSMYGDSKAHQDTKTRVLLAIYRYMNKYQIHNDRFSIVVGQPFSKHTTEEKNVIKGMLSGHHEYVVNGDHLSISIDNIEVATEGGSAYWINQAKGLARYIDIGSGTVNAITVLNGKIINSSSETFNFGTETVKNKSLAALANGIIRNTSQLNWKREDAVFLGGGVAEIIKPLICQYYMNAQVLDTSEHPMYVNATGFYEIAKRLYSNNTTRNVVAR